MELWIPGDLSQRHQFQTLQKKAEKKERLVINYLRRAIHACSSPEQWLMQSPSQQSCEIKIISYTEEEPKAQKDSHPPCPAAVLPLRSQYQSPINASRQRLRIVPSVPGVWDLRHSQGHGPWLTVLVPSSSCCCGNELCSGASSQLLWGCAQSFSSCFSLTTGLELSFGSSLMPHHPSNPALWLRLTAFTGSEAAPKQQKQC